MQYTNETVGALDEKVDRIDSRVDIMERAPADDAKGYRKTAVTAIVSTVATAIATGLIF